jgi:alkylation response protein AidB-like acyl-CoA dehydrogenase
MQIPQQYRRAKELEEFLGSPLDPKNIFSFKRSVELDESTQYPEQACELLNAWGLQEYYIPVSEGGKHKSFDELLALMRIVARRDLTVAIAHAKTFLGAVSGWISGDQDQKSRLARMIKRKGQIALGLTERAHGSDILAGGVRAVKGEQGYSLSGEKWLINNATRGNAVTVLARTDDHGGPRSLSLFLVEKDELNKSSYSELQKIKTLGIAGADISGIQFKDCLISHRALVGKPGLGLEILLKGFQITRTMISGLCLGAADTALRITMNFALSRKLYGESVFTIPHARGVLVDAFLDLLICDCVAIASARALHVIPGQMSILSSLSKYFVPTAIEGLMHNLSIVLGARHYLREGHYWGVFQKILRDSAILSVFDGSTTVNLNVISPQLSPLAEIREKRNETGREEAGRRLRQIFCLDEELAEFDPSKLSLHNGGRDDVVQSLETAVAELQRLQSEETVDKGVLESILELSGRLIDHLRMQENLLRRGRSGQGAFSSQSAEAFEMASRYSRVHAGAACVQMWLHNRERLGDFFGRGEWLAMSLERLVKSFEPERNLEKRKYEAEVAQELLRLYEENHLFSIAPWRLAGAPGTQDRNLM